MLLTVEFFSFSMPPHLKRPAKKGRRRDQAERSGSGLHVCRYGMLFVTPCGVRIVRIRYITTHPSPRGRPTKATIKS